MVETSTSKKCYIKYPFRIGDHLWRPVSSLLFLYLHMIVFVDIPTLLPVPSETSPQTAASIHIQFVCHYLLEMLSNLK